MWSMASPKTVLAKRALPSFLFPGTSRAVSAREEGSLSYNMVTMDHLIEAPLGSHSPMIWLCFHGFPAVFGQIIHLCAYVL